MGANAQTTVPTFTAAQVLTADQMNQSARTGVPVFADTTARDAGFGGSGEKVLAEGQLCYVENLSGVSQIQYYDGATWVSLIPSGVVQVKSATKTDTFTTTSTTLVDITGLSVSITPTSASNLVYCFFSVTCQSLSGTNIGSINLVRGSTLIAQADTAGSRQRATSIVNSVLNPSGSVSVNGFLDSPATTSSTTYKLQIKSNNAGTVWVNRSGEDTDNATFARAISTITVMEVTP